MRILLLAVVVLLLPVAGVARDGNRVEYLGGTRADIPEGKSGEIRLSDNTYFIYLTRKTEVRIPYERINLLEFGQEVNRPYLGAAIISPVFMMIKKREDFLTVGFEDDDGHQQAMLFRVNKQDLRVTLVGLEARTGQKVEFQDEQARVAGK